LYPPGTNPRPAGLAGGDAEPPHPHQVPVGRPAHRRGPGHHGTARPRSARASAGLPARPGEPGLGVGTNPPFSGTASIVRRSTPRRRDGALPRVRALQLARGGGVELNYWQERRLREAARPNTVAEIAYVGSKGLDLGQTN
jgi:hypothetical protein